MNKTLHQSRSRFHFLLILFSSVLVTGLASVPAAEAQAQNRLFVNTNSFVGEVDLTTPDRITTEIFVPPALGFGESPRDLVVDQNDNIFLFNGTFTPTLLTRTASTGAIFQLNIPGFSTTNDLSFGGIGRLDDFVFLTDTNTFMASEQGIIRVDLTDNSFTRFATNISTQDLNIGLDGSLLALSDQVPADEVLRFDPLTGLLIETISIPTGSHRSVAGLADGTFLTATLGGDIFHFDGNGNVINSLEFTGVFDRFIDIDVAPDGQVAVGTDSFGDVILTTTALSTFERFSTLPSGFSGETFVTFAQDFSTAAVPEPSTGLVLGICGISFLLQRRRRSFGS